MPDFDYMVGEHSIRLPDGHALPKYQQAFKRYDFVLGELARMVSKKYPGSTRIDIGANVGDSWALMNKHVIADTLLIEGDPSYKKHLDINLQRLGHPAQVCDAFCGVERENITEADIRRTEAGTTSIQKTSGHSGGQQEKSADMHETEIPILTFQEIINQFQRYKDSKLIKIDTDGYDFGILKANAHLFLQMNTTIYYECAPFEMADGMKDSIESFSELSKFFSHFIIYDNYGHFICSIYGEHALEKYVELMVFLASNRTDGAAVYYFDIAAFTPQNRDVFSHLKDFEISRFFNLNKGH